MNVWALIRDTVKQWTDSRALLFGAALSFYAVISLPSLLVVAISVAGVFIGKEDVQARLINAANESLGASAAAVVESVIETASLASLSSFSTIVGALVLIWVAANVFSQLQTALNVIWGIKKGQGRVGARLYVRKRLFALLIVFGLGFLILASFVISAVATGLERLLADGREGLGLLLQLTEVSVSFALIVSILAVTYKVLPAAEIRWLDVLPGALITTFLYSIGKYFIALYLARSNLASAYGAASSTVLMLLGIYYSSLIFLMGAVFTKVYTDQRRSGSEAG